MIGEKIFITGGAGYLGSRLVQRYYQTNDITVYSRVILEIMIYYYRLPEIILLAYLQPL